MATLATDLDPTDSDLAADVFAALTAPGHVDARRQRAVGLVAKRYGCTHATAAHALDDVLTKAAKAAVAERAGS